MKVVVEIDPHDEVVDAGDPTGLTEKAYEAVVRALAPYGDISDVRQEDE